MFINQYSVTIACLLICINENVAKSINDTTTSTTTEPTTTSGSTTTPSTTTTIPEYTDYDDATDAVITSSTSPTPSSIVFDPTDQPYLLTVRDKLTLKLSWSLKENPVIAATVVEDSTSLVVSDFKATSGTSATLNVDAGSELGSTSVRFDDEDGTSLGEWKVVVIRSTSRQDSWQTASYIMAG